MKGIILAGGSGSRLFPLTKAISKQLLPVFDKPMVYYPLSVLMLAGIKEILLITTARDSSLFRALLGDGGQWGLSISYEIQAEPGGLPQAFVIGESFLAGDGCAMVLGDNVFFGEGLGAVVSSSLGFQGATVFCTRVLDPQRYGVVEFGPDGSVVALSEKPRRPRSDWALTGLYVFDGDVCQRAASLKPSKRGELEIVDLLNQYQIERRLNVVKLGRGYAWFDAGTHDSLLEASEFVRTIERRQGLKVACLEEIAFRKQFITAEQFLEIVRSQGDTPYGRYLQAVADGDA